jgi:hypothetical protein
MADAFIYYRLESNGTDNSQALYPAPTNLTNRNTLVDNLVANWPEQILLFTIPEELVQSIGMTYENNIKDAPVSNPDGVRRINKQDNGINSIKWKFMGRFTDKAEDIKTLVNMAVLLQVEPTAEANALQFGKFGFYTNSTILRPFNLDPDNSIGLTIGGFGLNRDSIAPTTFDFDVNMTLGGTYVGIP